MKTNLARAYSETLQAVLNCAESGNGIWMERWISRLDHLDKMMPSGSGLDSGVTLDRDGSTPEELVFAADYHQMDEGGSYNGWVDNTIKAKPSFSGITIEWGGDDDTHADYICDVVGEALRQEVDTAATYPEGWAT